MRFFRERSISWSLSLLVVLSILPAFAILFYTDFENRQRTVESARQEVALTVRGMAEKQKEITRSKQQLLTTLARLPEIRALNIEESTRILADIIALNPNYNNLALVALDGSVITSGTGR